MQKAVSFNCTSYTIPAGNRLEVKLIVNGTAADNMWFAYDTTAYNSRLELPSGETDLRPPSTVSVRPHSLACPPPEHSFTRLFAPVRWLPL